MKITSCKNALLALVLICISCGGGDDQNTPSENSVIFDGQKYTITEVNTQLNGYGIVYAKIPYGPIKDEYNLRFFFKGIPMADGVYKVTTIQRAGSHDDEVGIEMRDIYDSGVHEKYYFSDGDGTALATVKSSNGKTSVTISDVDMHYTSGATYHEVKKLSARVAQN